MPVRKPHIRTVSTWTLALFFIAAGLNHFVSPGFYLRIMPTYLPWHEALVAISGVCEVLGGLLVLVPRTRGLAGYGLIALLIAVFPANVEAALRYGARPEIDLLTALLWIRVPFQAVLIVWVWWTCLKEIPPQTEV